MSKALVDTTVLTDILLNSGQTRKDSENAVSRYAETLLPVFAIKEFRSGPLRNFVWMHNKLVTVGSYEKALEALQRMSRTPRRYTTSTAIQALKEASGSIAQQTPRSLEKRYGKDASLDSILYDEFRLAIKTAIMMAWKRRRSITTSIVHPLPCFREGPPEERRGLIDLGPKACDTVGECSLAPLLRSKLAELKQMWEAIKDSEKTENVRRARILRQIFRNPTRTILKEDCIYLGDAIFVILCPEDAVILTTNILDYLPIAHAVGKEAVPPPQSAN